MKAAIDELQANGRPDVTGASSYSAMALPTGHRRRYGQPQPTANAPVTSGSGDNNGFQTNPTGAYADDTSYAQDASSGTNTNTGCGDPGKDRHDFYNYGISVPGTNTVTGIQVRLVARVDSTSSTTRKMCVQLSWDGGVTWTAASRPATWAQVIKRTRWAAAPTPGATLGRLPNCPTPISACGSRMSPTARAEPSTWTGRQLGSTTRRQGPVRLCGS